jgi:glycosyltransferase involved in cell wall biosynthesis
MKTVSYPASAPRLLLIATLDRSLRNFFPHMDACRAAGIRVDVACRISDFDDEIRGHCDKLFDVPFRRFPLHPLNAVTLLRLIAIIKAHNYDIVHAHTPAGGMIGRAAATIAKSPIRMYMAHGFHFHPEGKPFTNFIFSGLERFAGKFLSDWVEVINTEDYQSALSFGIVSERNLVMIDGTGIETARFDPATVSEDEQILVRHELGLAPGAPVIGVIAELIPRKRLHDTIDAIALLKYDFPQATLIILGSGDQRSELDDYAAKRGVSENVRFLGFRRDLPRFIRVMDVFAFSTQQEGLPAALMEAMCMGVPSVATNIRGNRDIIVDGENGFLVPVGDCAAMARACKTIIDDKLLASKFAAVGRELIVSKYDTQRTVAQQMRAYGRAMSVAKKLDKLRGDVEHISVGDSF